MCCWPTRGHIIGKDRAKFSPFLRTCPQWYMGRSEVLIRGKQWRKFFQMSDNTIISLTFYYNCLL
jgi:hypothetical protein